MFYHISLDFCIIIGYSINFFLSLALAALSYCLTKIEKKRLSLFCWVLKFQLLLNVSLSTLLFIFQPIFLFPAFAGYSMNPICQLVPFCARINLSFCLLLLLHFPIYFIFSSLFQLSRVRLTLNELLDYHKIYVINRHRKCCVILAIIVLEFIMLLSFMSLIIFGSLSRFETSTLLNANGLSSFIPYLPFAFMSSITVYIFTFFVALFLMASIFGIFYLFLRVKSTLTEFRVVGSPGLHFQSKLLRILYYQLILANIFLFIPILTAIIFTVIKWEYSSLCSTLLFLWISTYPVCSHILLIMTTPHFWQRICLTFKPIYSTNPGTNAFFGIHQSPTSQQLYRY